MNHTSQRLSAAALAAIGVASAIPIPLAGLDFAGVLDIFNIDNGDTPRGVIAIVVVAAILTTGVLALACVGVALAAVGSPAARPVLVVSAVAGVVTAMPAWLPTGVLLGAAAYLLGRDEPEGATQPSQGRASRPPLFTETAHQS